MGVVYEAFDRTTGERIALKTLRDMRGHALWHLKHELRALQGLHHPNLAHLGELHRSGHHWFFTMELIDGVDVLAYIGRPGMLATAPEPARRTEGAEVEARGGGEGWELRLRDALSQLAAGMGALHAAGLVHRDIKPSNCLVTASGRLVLLDFGLITGATESAPGTGQRLLVGTPEYMAPEQAAARAVGPKADLYSLGVVLYEALTGQLPLSGPVHELLERKQHEAPPRPSALAAGVPADLDVLCMELLARHPSERPALIEVIERLGGQSSIANPVRGLRAAEWAAESRVRAGRAEPLVGRERELAALHAALGDVHGERAVAVLLTGEPGVGKSRLLARFVAEIVERRRDAVVLSGRCYARETVPYKALDGVMDSLAQYLGKLPAIEAAALLPRWAGALVQAFPVLEQVAVMASAPRPAGLGQGGDGIGDGTGHVAGIGNNGRDRVMAALHELLAKLAARRTVVIAIDDLHWSDSDSLAMLRELVRPPEAPELLLVATVRCERAPGELGGRASGELGGRASGELGGRASGEPVQAALALPGDVRELAVRRLDHEASCELIRQLMPESVRWGSGEIAAIAASAGGHPWLLEELVLHVAGRDPHAASRNPANEHSPGNRAITGSDHVPLDEALWARIEELDAPDRTVVELVCTAGGSLKPAVVAAAAAVRLAELGPLRKRLELARLVRASADGHAMEPYHDRVRAAVLARLDAARRRRNHRQLAELLEAAGEDSTLLAHHWREAGERARAARHAARAAAAAARARAFEQAAALYRQALALAGDEPGAELESSERLAWEAGLAGALIRAGRASEAAALYQAVARSGWPWAGIELRRLAAEHAARGGRLDEALTTLDELLALVDGHADKRSRLERRARHAWQALRGGVRLGERRVIDAQALATEMLDVQAPATGTLDAQALATELLDVLALATETLALVAPGRAGVVAARHLDQAQRMGDAERLARALAYQAMARSARTNEIGSLTARLRQRMPAGFQAAQRQAAPAARPASAAHAAGLVAMAEGIELLTAGRWRPAQDTLDRAAALLDEVDAAVVPAAMARLLAAWALVYRGDLAELGRRMPLLTDQARERGDHLLAMLAGTSVAHVAALAADQPERARSQLEAQTPWPTSWQASWQKGHMLALPEWAAFCAHIDIDLYQGKWQSAQARLGRVSTRMQSSPLMRVQLVRIASELVHVRCALAAARGLRENERPRFIERARQGLARIERERAGWPLPFLLLGRAGLAALAGVRDQAQTQLAAAAAAFDHQAMPVHAAAARYGRGELLHGDPGHALRETAAAWMHSRGIRNPHAFAAMLAPAVVA